jgi:hypothetical protein
LSGQQVLHEWSKSVSSDGNEVSLR